MSGPSVAVPYGCLLSPLFLRWRVCGPYSDRVRRPSPQVIPLPCRSPSKKHTRCKRPGSAVAVRLATSTGPLVMPSNHASSTRVRYTESFAVPYRIRWLRRRPVWDVSRGTDGRQPMNIGRSSFSSLVCDFCIEQYARSVDLRYAQLVVERFVVSFVDDR